ncbi:major facilitator superfamily domain-containing protein [Desarmillaria tabescens]|uniref:Major facilitator superfamily domain-containing protein n=1 Tax=Armillaria tabescens TaxID=1929756 RepID=A0AA39NP90_ARMTA|nr:major facilitator superfamily domain-containing protein [Desarmillaria tabescens]KAK0469322.1 major facilitator superfamily domain-containing protein [Desarmillaria tabescens]
MRLLKACISKRIRESTVCGDPASEASESTRAIDTATVPDVVPKSYTPGNIWFVVGLVSLAGLASPFPATIYFPSLPILTQVFHETTERLNLTLTIFLVPMAVFPMVWGPLSDRWGRRPCIIASLVILTLTCVGLALVPTNAFWLLMFLRFLQSAGCTGTVALGAGAIADITTRADRGGYFGAFNVGPMVGPCVGPVIGGLLAQYLGWRSIFWFLAIFSAVLLALLLLFLPETLPCIVGDGSIRPSFIYRPWIKVFRRSDCQDSVIAHRPPPKPLCNPFSLIAHLDILVGLFYASVSFAIQYSISGTLANAYKVHYPFLNSANVGLCYLANGGGLILGAIINGRVLDFDYRRARGKFLRAAQDKDKAINGHVLRNFENFPLESVRLKWSPHFVIMYAACVIGWGWCVEKSVFLAGPLSLQVALGFASISVINTIMTLMVDLIPNQSSSITACVNFMRASLAAILISVQDKAISGVGYGWTYTILGAICALMLPMVFLQIKIGPNCRGRRRQRDAPPASV